MRVVIRLLAIVIISAIFAGLFIYFSENENGNKNPSAVETAEDSIILSEFMASNSSYLPDDKGEYSDWIEIYNLSNAAVNLENYGLSNDKDSARWKFPPINIEPKGYMVIFASGNATEGTEGVYQHAGFKLSADKGGVYLFNENGALIDSEEYKDQSGNISMSRNLSTNEWNSSDKPTPGFSNDVAGYDAYQQSRYKKGSDIFITEVMPSNKTTITDNKGVYSDYIEIYNSGDKTINLLGYGLSDDPQDVLKWKFPDISIDAGEYLLVFASGKNTDATDISSKAIHTDFRISAYKESLVLSDPMGYILDEISISEMTADTAFSRVFEGSGYGSSWTESNKPTPGAANR